MARTGLSNGLLVRLCATPRNKTQALQYICFYACVPALREKFINTRILQIHPGRAPRRKHPGGCTATHKRRE